MGSEDASLSFIEVVKFNIDVGENNHKEVIICGILHNKEYDF